MKRPSVADLALVGKAFLLAERAHAKHLRYSGEPYFTHLFETARTLAELGMDAPTIAAGLLHDSIEDVGVTAKTIGSECGEEVLLLVQGVTNLGRIKYRGVNRYSESMRRFFIASAKDLRVLLIKLADRLHNMRTLAHVPEEKQRRIAEETLEIYSPLAYRLGIRRISRDLQELAFPFAHPEEFKQTRALLREKEQELTKRLEKFHHSLLRGLARQNIIPLSAQHRIKGLYSLYRKLKHKNGDFGKIYDLLAVRIVVPTVEECYRVLGAIHALWRPLPGRIKDYIAFPKPNGYRSVQTTVFTGDDGTVEVQIRTEEMHREAEYGITAHFEYKERGGEKEKDPSYLGWAKQMLSALVSWGGKDAGDETAARRSVLLEEDAPAWVKHLGELGAALEERQFWTHLREDVFKSRVFVCTPKGDVVDLPADSSAIDFAYSIHSDIGDHLFGVKVNGKFVPIETHLKNGDIVEILTRDGSHPTRKWLELTRTALAKKHIRAALAKLDGTSVS